MMILMVMVMVMVVVIMMVVVMRNVMTDDLRVSSTRLNPPAKAHQRIQTTMGLPLSDNFSKEIRSKFQILYLCLFITENQ